MKLLMLSLTCLGLLAAADIAASATPAGKSASSNVASPASGPAADDNGVVDTVRRNRYELQRVNMSSPRSTPDAELAGKVQQVRSMDLATKPAVDVASPAKATTSPVAPAAPGQSGSPLDIDAQTLEKLRQLPGGPVKALAIADSLFGSRRYDTAFAFYEMALKAAPSEDTNAWILFQMGNCRRASDPVAARQYYKRVGADAPDSAWSKAAAAQDRLVEWEQANSPHVLLEKPGSPATTVQTGSTRPAALEAQPVPAATGKNAQPEKAVPPAADAVNKTAAP